MGNIVKVIFEDNKELTLDIKSAEILDSDTDDAKYQKKREREIELRKFQRTILREMDYSLVEDWAKDEFDLIEENEAECHYTHLDTCSDNALTNEAEQRGLMYRFNQTIMNDNFETRFAKIVEHESPITIENWLSEMESRLRIVG